VLFGGEGGGGEGGGNGEGGVRGGPGGKLQVGSVAQPID
jgi:hypothetical protein